ncbi:MAG: sulfite exporter TauE/SafE family protein [Candidatus Tectomicrobia bacterium]|uniref:Probable membrane transporter protein n=1 Tax=Tectimicrobiota bacterium TaxID=2528274 RepID=A0A932M1F3_UNCTE|nr:sulfite exporter TauE/SafE family protein [Candidatus Tectomicrobia bacterium]
MISSLSTEWILVLVFLMGAVVSAFATLVGGGSLLTIPILILLGLPSQVAIATNRFGNLGLLLAGLYKFGEKKLVNYKLGSILAVSSVLGSVAGANLVLKASDLALRRTIAVMTFLVLGIFMLMPGIGLRHRDLQLHWGHWFLGILISFGLGVYGGFFGAAMGTFFTYLLVLLFGESFIESAGTRKIASTALSLAATFIYMWHQKVLYNVGFSLFAGMALGSYFGAHYSTALGNLWIRRLFIGVVILLAARLLV